MFIKLLLFIAVAICNVQHFNAFKTIPKFESNLVTWTNNNNSTKNDLFILLNPVQENIIRQLESIEDLTYTLLDRYVSGSSNDIDICQLSKEQLSELDDSIKQSIKEFSQDTNSQVDCDLVDKPSTCEELVTSILCALKHSENAARRTLDEYRSKDVKWKNAFDKLLGNVERQLSEIKRTAMTENAQLISELEEKLATLRYKFNELYLLLKAASEKLLNHSIRDGNLQDALEQIRIVSESTHSTEEEVVSIGVALAYQLHCDRRIQDGYGDRLELNSLIRNIFRVINGLGGCKSKLAAMKSLLLAMGKRGHMNLEHELVLTSNYKSVGCFDDTNIPYTMNLALKSALSDVTILLESESDHETLLKMLNNMENCASYLDEHWPKIIDDLVSKNTDNTGTLAKFINNPSLKCPNQISKIIYHSLESIKTKIGLWNSDVLSITSRIFIESKNNAFLDWSSREDKDLLLNKAKGLIPAEFIGIYWSKNCKVKSDAGFIYSWHPKLYTHPFLYSSPQDGSSRNWHFETRDDGQTFTMRNTNDYCFVSDPEPSDVHAECRWGTNVDSYWLIKPVRGNKIRIQNTKSGKFITAIRPGNHEDKVKSLWEIHLNTNRAEQFLDIRCSID